MTVLLFSIDEIAVIVLGLENIIYKGKFPKGNKGAMVSFREVLIFLDMSVRNFFSIMFPLTTEIPWELIFHTVSELLKSV